VASTLADPAGADLVARWISSISTCDAGGGGGCHAAAAP
jgi:hypothetical protein